MASNQTYKEYRVLDLPTSGLKAGDKYYLNVGPEKYKTFIVSDNLVLTGEAGNDFIEKDTMAEFRAISAREIWAIENGYYKGVKLNGYYTAGDTPAPIDYYISDTTDADDGGSVVVVGTVKFEHIFIDTLHTIYFGVASSRTDWRDIFVKHLNRNVKIICENYKEYLISNSITVNDAHARIEANGSKFTTPETESFTDLIVHINSESESYPVSSVAFNVANNGITRITYTGPSFSVGDVLKIFSDDITTDPYVDYLNPTRQFNGEFVTVISTAIIGGQQQISVQGSLYYNYTTNIKITKVPIFTLEINNLASDNNFKGKTIECRRTFKPNIYKLTHEKGSRPGINFTGCYLPTVSSSDFNMVEDAVAGIGRPNTIGYGINGSSNYGLKIFMCTFSGLRHGYTSGGNELGTDWLQRGMERNTHVLGCNFSNCQLALDSHEAGRDFLWASNTINNCAAAFQVRCGYTTITNNVVSKCNVLLFSINDVVQGTKLKGNTVDTVGATAIRVTRRVNNGVPSNKIGVLELSANTINCVVLTQTSNTIIKSSGNEYNFLKVAGGQPFIIGEVNTTFKSKGDTWRQESSYPTSGHWLFQFLENCQGWVTNATFENINISQILRNNAAETNTNNTIILDSIIFNEGIFDITNTAGHVHPSALPSLAKYRASNLRRYNSNTANDVTSYYKNVLFGEASNPYDINSFIAYKNEDVFLKLNSGGTGPSVDKSTYVMTSNACIGVKITILNTTGRSVIMPTLNGVAVTIPNNETVVMSFTDLGWRYNKPMSIV